MTIVTKRKPQSVPCRGAANCDGRMHRQRGSTLRKCNKCGYAAFVCAGFADAGHTGRMICPPLEFGVIDFANRLIARFEDEHHAETFAASISGTVRRL